MRCRHALIGLSMVALTCLLAGSAWAQRDNRMWYRGYFQGPVTVRNQPQPGYYYQPAPNTTRPLFEHRHGYPLICQSCRAYYQPGMTRCVRCDARLPGKRHAIDHRTVYSPYQLPGQYWYEEPRARALTAPRNIGPNYLRYRNPWD